MMKNTNSLTNWPKGNLSQPEGCSYFGPRWLNKLYFCTLPDLPVKSELSLGAFWKFCWKKTFFKLLRCLVGVQVTSLRAKPCIWALLNFTCIQNLIRTCIWQLQAVPLHDKIHLITMNNWVVNKLLTKIICCMTSDSGGLICWLQSVEGIIIIAVPNFPPFF